MRSRHAVTVCAVVGFRLLRAVVSAFVFPAVLSSPTSTCSLRLSLQCFCARVLVLAASFSPSLGAFLSRLSLASPQRAPATLQGKTRTERQRGAREEGKKEERSEKRAGGTGQERATCWRGE